IPWLIFGIPIVEIVVMVREGEKILCACTFVELHQLFRIPIFRVPLVNDVLKSKVLRRTVMVGMKPILLAARLIHTARIPVAILRLALRTPMSPNSELRIAKPFRRLILLKRLPRGLELASGDGLKICFHDDRGGPCRRYGANRV